MLVLPGGPWPVVALTLGSLMVAASLASDSIWRSLLGAPLRQEGMLIWAGFGVAFAAGLSLRRASRDASAASLVDAAVVTVLAVGTTGTLELVGVELDADLIEFKGRVRSTLGSPTVLSGLLVLLGPIAALASARRGLWRWAGVSSAVLAIVNLAAAETRAAWAAVIVVGVTASLLRVPGLAATAACGGRRGRGRRRGVERPLAAVEPRSARADRYMGGRGLVGG